MSSCGHGSLILRRRNVGGIQQISSIGGDHTKGVLRCFQWVTSRVDRAMGKFERPPTEPEDYLSGESERGQIDPTENNPKQQQGRQVSQRDFKAQRNWPELVLKDQAQESDRKREQERTHPETEGIPEGKQSPLIGVITGTRRLNKPRSRHRDEDEEEN